MVFDRTENEPDEWDPEEEFRDPDSDSLTIPKVPTEDAGSTLREDFREEHDPDASSVPEFSASDAPSELRTTFWALVLVIDAALLALSLGLMFLVFEGDTSRGLPLVAGGLALFGFAGRRYRAYRTTTDGSESDDEREPADTDADAAEVDAHLDAGDSECGDSEPTR